MVRTRVPSAWSTFVRNTPPERRRRLHVPLEPLDDPADLIDASTLAFYMAVRRPEWMAEAACRGPDVADFFEGKTAGALAVCGSCPVCVDCLDYALSFPANEDVGVFGGTTARERRAMRPAS